MNYTNFHGQPFLFINEDAGEFPLPVEKQEVDLTMHYRTVGEVIHCRFFNKDESEAELCGNALLGLMQEKGKGAYIFQIKAGKLEGINTGKELRLRMKKADVELLPVCENESFSMFNVNVGNPHMICLDKKHFEPNPRGLTLTNFHSVIQKDNNTFEVRCFERGVGETQACGSGAYAVGSAMMQHFNLEEVNIEMKGGKYTVKPQTLIVKI